MGDFGVLVHAGYSRKKAIFFDFTYSLTAVVGALTALVIGSNSQQFMHFLIPFAAGGFIYIAGSDLIPELHKETDERKSAIQLLSFVLGIVVMAAMIFLE